MKMKKSDISLRGKIQHQKDVGYNLMDKYLGALAGLAEVKTEVSTKMNLKELEAIMPETTQHTLCKQCPHSDRSVHYSDWHYCNNPKNSRDFTVIRHYHLMTNKPYKPTAPDWCPHKITFALLHKGKER